MAAPISPEVIGRLRGDLDTLLDAAVTEMFEAHPGGTSPFDWDFSAREDAAERLGKAFAVCLLKHHLKADPRQREIAWAQKHACPCCGELCERAEDPRGNPRTQSSTVKAKPGKTTLEEPLFYCRRCRRLFSPLPTPLGPRTRGL